MIPQIEALRNNHADLITNQNLIYWENANDGHDLDSFESEMEHGLPMLFR